MLMTRYFSFTLLRTPLVGAEKDPPRSARVTTAVAATEPLVRILLNLDADSVPNEFISGFVRRQTNARPSAATCRGRAPRPWNDVTLIRPFERVTLARFSKVTGGPIQAEPFYDDVRDQQVSMSTRLPNQRKEQT
jgi:hypothetical protein